LLEEILPHDGQIAPLAYYPGTELFRRAVSNGLVSADIFETTSAEALFVRSDPFVEKASQRLMSCLTRVGKKAVYRHVDYAAQKRLLGYCHATNLQAGDMYAGQGRWDAARHEYEEIVEHEPGNPWGWLALGELALDHQLWDDSIGYYMKAHKIVPKHMPVMLALAEVTYRSGDHQGGRKWLAAAEALAPGDHAVVALRRYIDNASGKNRR
jgi:tetratricopeptide (TPR) repeat protein